MKTFFIYILAGKKNGTLYIGMTNNLIKRVYEHKHGLVDGYTKKYNLHKLAYSQKADCFMRAITREKQLKKWKREWKIELIEKNNPMWKDLYDEIT